MSSSNLLYESFSTESRHSNDFLEKVTQDRIPCMKPRESISMLTLKEETRHKETMQRRSTIIQHNREKLLTMIDMKNFRFQNFVEEENERNRKSTWRVISVVTFFAFKVHEKAMKKRQEVHVNSKRNISALKIQKILRNWYNKMLFRKYMEFSKRLLKHEWRIRFQMRIRAKMRCRNLLVSFLTDFQDDRQIIKIVSRFMQKVKRCQQIARNYIICRRARLRALGSCWDDVEREFLEKLKQKKSSSQRKMLPFVLSSSSSASSLNFSPNSSTVPEALKQSIELKRVTMELNKKIDHWCDVDARLTSLVKDQKLKKIIPDIDSISLPPIYSEAAPSMYRMNATMSSLTNYESLYSTWRLQLASELKITLLSPQAKATCIFHILKEQRRQHILQLKDKSVSVVVQQERKKKSVTNLNPISDDDPIKKSDNKRRQSRMSRRGSLLTELAQIPPPASPATEDYMNDDDMPNFEDDNLFGGSNSNNNSKAFKKNASSNKLLKFNIEDAKQVLSYKPPTQQQLFNAKKFNQNGAKASNQLYETEEEFLAAKMGLKFLSTKLNNVSSSPSSSSAAEQKIFMLLQTLKPQGAHNLIRERYVAMWMETNLNLIQSPHSRTNNIAFGQFLNNQVRQSNRKQLSASKSSASTSYF